MENAPTEIETETRAVKGELLKVLEAMPERSQVNEARKLRQNAIIDNLPPDFAIEMRAAILSFTTKKGIEPSNFDGELFEQMVRADKNICPQPESLLAKTLRSVMKEPDIYRAKEIGVYSALRQPDLAEIDEQGNIKAAVEIKLHQINHPSQFKFKENFKKAIGILRGIKNNVLKRHGLDIIAENKERLGVSPDFKTKIAISFGIYDGTLDSLFGSMPQEFKNIGKEILGDSEVYESPFSFKEITAMADHLMDKQGVNRLPHPGR